VSKKINIPEILKENKKRNAEMDAPHNPITGEGRFVKRKMLSYSYDGNMIEFMAPVTMFDERIVQEVNGKSIEEVLIENKVKRNKRKVLDIHNEIVLLRLKHDFEFYAYACVKIPDKLSDKIIPFKLNRAQRKLLARYERMRNNGIPIRTILCKARQWGGSTLTQLYENWIQLYHKENWNLGICALVDAQASHISYMFERTLEHLPDSFGKFTLKPYAKQSKNRIIEERGGIIGIGSVKQPDNLRSYSIHLLHLSEVGFWTSTPRQSAESLIQTLRGSVPPDPYTMIVMESTAKGVGNFFHNEWLAAKEGRSSYDPVFVAWWEIEMYRKKIDDLDSFINNMNDYDWFLWQLGATLEGINWYKTKKKAENFSDLQMMQEFPSTADEAFTSTGRPVFAKIHVKQAERTCIEPLYKGELRGNATKGAEALTKLEFEEKPVGDLWIWALPDSSIKVSNRYAAFADVGGKHKDADYSCIKVIDRYWMIDGGTPEVVAVWHGHLDQDLVAWKFAQIAKWYNNALLAVESNSLRKENKDGDHFLTVLDEISEYYDNLYTRTDPEKVKENIPVVWGFHTNLKTKPMIINKLNEALRDQLYVERDIRACNEMYMYELKDDGTYGAPEGQHDDHVITTAGVTWLGLKYMDPPREIRERPIKKRKIIGEATI
jgi:hypothetical protein